ncbi:hypothetical protein OROGR_032926 [Orobanche gracilis]
MNWIRKSFSSNDDHSKKKEDEEEEADLINYPNLQERSDEAHNAMVRALTWVSLSDNQKEEYQNQDDMSIGSTSDQGNKKKKYIGVQKTRSGSHAARIRKPKQKGQIWIGTFDTAEAAARAYDEKAREFYPQGGKKLNFRDNIGPSDNQVASSLYLDSYENTGLIIESSHVLPWTDDQQIAPPEDDYQEFDTSWTNSTYQDEHQ